MKLLPQITQSDITAFANIIRQPNLGDLISERSWNRALQSLQRQYKEDRIFNVWLEAEQMFYIDPTRLPEEVTDPYYVEDCLDLVRASEGDQSAVSCLSIAAGIQTVTRMHRDEIGIPAGVEEHCVRFLSSRDLQPAIAMRVAAQLHRVFNKSDYLKYVDEYVWETLDYKLTHPAYDDDDVEDIAEIVAYLRILRSDRLNKYDWKSVLGGDSLVELVLAHNDHLFNTAAIVGALQIAFAASVQVTESGIVQIQTANIDEGYSLPNDLAILT